MNAFARSSAIAEKLHNAPLFAGRNLDPLPSTSLSRVVVVFVAMRAMRPLRALRSVACVNVALLHRPRGLPAN